MALGSLPSLTQINTELGTSGQSLVTCISNAGKTGTWDSQLDFAGYSAESVVADPDFFDLIHLGLAKITSTITSSGNWETNPITPSWITVTTSSGVSGGNMVFSVSTNSGSARDGTITVRLVSDNSITDTVGVHQDSP